MQVWFSGDKLPSAFPFFFFNLFQIWMIILPGRIFLFVFFFLFSSLEVLYIPTGLYSFFEKSAASLMGVSSYVITFFSCCLEDGLFNFWHVNYNVSWCGSLCFLLLGAFCASGAWIFVSLARWGKIFSLLLQADFLSLLLALPLRCPNWNVEMLVAWCSRGLWNFSCFLTLF